MDCIVRRARQFPDRGPRQWTGQRLRCGHSASLFVADSMPKSDINATFVQVNNLTVKDDKGTIRATMRTDVARESNVNIGNRITICNSIS